MSRIAHMPERTCRVCRKKVAKRELERWVLADGQLTLDKKQILSGRGVYTCLSNCSNQIDQFIGRLRSRQRSKR